jgi:hypothetical protein
VDAEGHLVSQQDGPPQTGYEHLWQVLESLALARADGNTPVEQLIWQETERFEADSTIIVITPSHSEQLAAALFHLENCGMTVVTILLDPARGLLRLSRHLPAPGEENSRGRR